MTKLMRFKYLIFLSAIILFSCAEENPNLVNPPSQAGTVHIRLLNLASDKRERILSIDGKNTQKTPYKSVSQAINPPLDSGFVSILTNDGKEEIVINRKLTFARGVTYTFIALPSHFGSETQRAVDTLLYAQTSTSIPPRTLEAYIKFFNAYPDSSANYYFRLGCPNGEIKIPSQSYKNQSPNTPIRSGNVAMTLLRSDFNGENIVALYEFNFQKAAQYLLILHDDGSGKEELSIIEQSDKSTTAFKPTKILNDRNAHIRIINLSNSTVSVNKKPDNTNLGVFEPYSISSYKDISACGTLTKDIFEIINPLTQEILATDSTSLEVLQYYSILIFDSDNPQRNKIHISQPLPPISKESNDISIRVFSAFKANFGLNISLGARYVNNAPNNYLTGEILASNLLYFKSSNISILKSGVLPITVFSSSQPTNYITSGLFETSSGKDYLLIVSSNEFNQPKLTLIEEREENKQIQFLSEGVFIQIVNAIPKFNSLSISTGNILQSAVLTYSVSLATILPTGSNSISFSNKSINLDIDNNQRILLVATGDANNIEILNFINPSMGATSFDYRRRFINASKDYPTISISEDTTKPPLIDYLEYGKASPIITLNKERKVSLFFLNSANNKNLFRIDDLLQVIGTNYTFIFTAKVGVDTTVIVQQEY